MDDMHGADFRKERAIIRQAKSRGLDSECFDYAL